jgi:hypothetical protein
MCAVQPSPAPRFAFDAAQARQKRFMLMRCGHEPFTERYAATPAVLIALSAAS